MSRFTGQDHLRRLTVRVSDAVPMAAAEQGITALMRQRPGKKDFFVMNIMLVSVTERNVEIGVRMAVGARRSDILRQVLIEAVQVCLIGGGLDVALAVGGGLVFDHFVQNFKMKISTTAIASAFAVSSRIGVAFGFRPARNAARLDPVEALARP